MNVCIDIIEKWSEENHLKINKKKSAILEFIHRRSQTTQLKIGDLFRDYPIVDKYKYLGTWLSQKLTLNSQTDFIERRMNSMKHKLNPCLYNTTLDARKNL